MASSNHEGKCYRAWRDSGLWCALVPMILTMRAAQAPGQCTEQQKLTASDTVPSARFGTAVSVSGETAFVGAPQLECAAGDACGAVYVVRFNGTTWVETQKLTPSDVLRRANFGAAGSLNGNTAVVAAPGADFAPPEEPGGVAFLFRIDGVNWVEWQKLTASDVVPADRFGRRKKLDERKDRSCGGGFRSAGR